MFKTFDIEYTLNNYIPVPESGCWIWMGGWCTAGYGKCNRHGRVWAYAHRLFYQTYKGEIPEGAYVLHKCDTRACCNPDHLFIGTHQENMDDMWRKRRARPGGKPAVSRKQNLGAAA